MKLRYAAKLTAVFAVCLISNADVFACPICRAAVRQTIYNNSFWFNLTVLASPLLLLAVFGVALFYWNELQTKFKRKLK